MVEVRQGTLTWMVVVEVRQRTLWIARRSWTRRTTRRRRRGGGEEEEKEEDEDEEDEEEATDIKSNNPHLAGGEKLFIMNWGAKAFTRQKCRDCLNVFHSHVAFLKRSTQREKNKHLRL